MQLRPTNHAEEIALFRAEIIGHLVRLPLARGALKAALTELSRRRFRPPDSEVTRSFSVPTLQRWYYAMRAGGIAALRPQTRADAGTAKALSAPQRALLLDIRREHPRASAALILRTLEADGRLQSGAVSAATVQRLFKANGLDSRTLRAQANEGRLRWQAEAPGALWHADVCHGPAIAVQGQPRKIRIHGMLDDASRYCVALEAHFTEREQDMLEVFVAALRRHGRPDLLYLDNGATYRGTTLATACGRLDIGLLHAKPYDPQARGKMERFWRSLRAGCLDHLGDLGSLHDVNVRLWAWLDQHYHRAPHAGLMGRAPGVVHAERARYRHVDHDALRDALTVRASRRLRRDATLSVDGVLWETDRGFLAGKTVTVASCTLDQPPAPWIEHDGKRFDLHRVDPVANSQRKRRQTPVETPAPTVPFDPAAALLDKSLGRAPRHAANKETR